MCLRLYAAIVWEIPKVASKTQHHQPGLGQGANVWLRAAFWLLPPTDVPRAATSIFAPCGGCSAMALYVWHLAKVRCMGAQLCPLAANTPQINIRQWRGARAFTAENEI